MRFKQFRSCQTHVEKLHRHLFNMEERDSDAELEAEEQRVPPIGANQPSLPPDVVPRQDGSIPAQSPPAHQQPPHHLGSMHASTPPSGRGKLVMVAPPRLPGIPRLVAPGLLTGSPRQGLPTPRSSLRVSSHLGASVGPKAPSTGMMASSSSNLDEIERKLRARERELEATEARVRETEEHARRLRELQEKEASLKEREEMLARREEEAKKLMAAAESSSNQSYASILPHRPIVLPSRFRLPDTARRIHLPIVRQGEEIPMDLSSASIDLTVGQKGVQSMQPKSAKPPVITTAAPAKEPLKLNTNQSVKEEKSCSPILERVISPRQETPVVHTKVLESKGRPLVTEQTMPSAPPLLVDMSSTVEMVGVSALVSPDSPAATTSTKPETTRREMPVSSTESKSCRKEERVTKLTHENMETLQLKPVSDTLHSMSQEAGKVTSLPQKQIQANVSVPYTSELAGEPHLTQGAILGVDVDELLKNGEVLTLLATEEEDGSLTLVSPPIPNKETGDDAEISVAKESQNAMLHLEPVQVQELEEELKVLKSEVNNIMKGAEEDFLYSKDPSNAASMVMAELCRENSLDTLEKRIESPRHGADLVEDFSKRLEDLERDQLELTKAGIEEQETKKVEEEMESELPDVMDEIYSSPGEITSEPAEQLVPKLDNIKTDQEVTQETSGNQSKPLPVSHVAGQKQEEVNEVKKRVNLTKEKLSTKRNRSPRRSTPQHQKKCKMDEDDIKQSVSQLERRSSRLKSREVEESELGKRKREVPANRLVMKDKVEKEDKSNASSSQKRNQRVIATKKRNIQSLSEDPNSAKNSISISQSEGCREAKVELDDELDDTVKDKGTRKPTVLPSLHTPTSKSSKQSIPASQAIKCGGCPATSQSEASWRQHVAKKHAGLARPRGESQIFTEEEEEQAIHQAFQTCKKIQCPRCKEESFCGLDIFLQHYRACGRVEVASRVVKQEEEEVVNPGGRSRRAAATKAKQKVAGFVEALRGKSNLDGASDADGEDKDVELSDDDDSDDNYDIEKEIGVATWSKFIIEGGKRPWRCTICNLDFHDKAAVEGHVFTKHQAEVDEQHDTESEVEESEEEDESDFADIDSDDSYARYRYFDLCVSPIQIILLDQKPNMVGSAEDQENEVLSI